MEDVKAAGKPQPRFVDSSLEMFKARVKYKDHESPTLRERILYIWHFVFAKPFGGDEGRVRELLESLQNKLHKINNPQEKEKLVQRYSRVLIHSGVAPHLYLDVPIEAQQFQELVTSPLLSRFLPFAAAWAKQKLPATHDTDAICAFMKGGLMGLAVAIAPEKFGGQKMSFEALKKGLENEAEEYLWSRFSNLHKVSDEYHRSFIDELNLPRPEMPKSKQDSMKQCFARIDALFELLPQALKAEFDRNKLLCMDKQEILHMAMVIKFMKDGGDTARANRKEIVDKMSKPREAPEVPVETPTFPKEAAREKWKRLQNEEGRLKNDPVWREEVAVAADELCQDEGHFSRIGALFCEGDGSELHRFLTLAVKYARAPAVKGLCRKMNEKVAQADQEIGTSTRKEIDFTDMLPKD